MSVLWKCDLCGKETHVNPPTKPMYDEVDGKKVPKTAILKQQDAHTGKMNDIKIHLHEDLKPRAFITKISIGQESIQKDFCKECLDKVLPNLKKAFNTLVNIESK